MKELGNGRQSGVAAPTPLSSRTRSRRDGAPSGAGIEVQEEELGTVTAQRLYKMRCECGRSWFELELPRLIQCPACAKLNLVSI
jgi:hypothetical protein